MKKLDIKAVDFSLVDVSGLDPIETKFVDINKDYVAQDHSAHQTLSELDRLGKEINEKKSRCSEVMLELLAQAMKLRTKGDLMNEFANTLTTEQLERVKERLLAAQMSDAPTSDAPTQ